MVLPYLQDGPKKANPLACLNNCAKMRTNKSYIVSFECETHGTLLWSPYVIGQTIIFLPCDFYLSIYLLFFLA